MFSDESFEEVVVDFVFAFDGSADQGSHAELIDDPGFALREMEDAPYCVVGKQVLIAARNAQAEADVVFRIFEAERF